MFQAVYWIHIILCAILIGIVLLQQGKGADAGAILSGGTDSVLGAGSAGNFVTRLTTTLAITFMVTSVILVRAYKYAPHPESAAVTNGLEGSVMEEVADQATPITAEVTDTDQSADDAQAPVAATSEADDKTAESSAEAEAVVENAIVDNATEQATAGEQAAGEQAESAPKVEQQAVAPVTEQPEKGQAGPEAAAAQ